MRQTLFTRKGLAEERLQEVQLVMMVEQVRQVESHGVQIPLRGAKVPPEGQEVKQDPL